MLGNQDSLSSWNQFWIKGSKPYLHFKEGREGNTADTQYSMTTHKERDWLPYATQESSLFH